MPGRNDELTVLDCTLRDGGYYNAWDFEPALVEQYLAAMEASGVDVIEIGFRSYPQTKFLGPFAYSTDEFLASLKLPLQATVGVMVNAGDLLARGDDAGAAVDALFRPASESPVDLVRIAAHLHEVAGCAPHLQRLKELGYRTGLNYMQVSRATDEHITELAALTWSFDSVDVLYFADSLGNMTPSDIRRVLEALRRGWPGPIGVHAHDNRARALTNTLEAAEHGATWLDSTVLGMGRGAGNVRTDFLLFELTQLGVDRYRPDALLPLAMGEFQALHERHGWGTNLLYLMSAAYDIHPTYVQMMMGDERYDATDAVGALNALRHLEGHSYNAERLNQAIAGDNGSADAAGTWAPAGWLADRDVLILGTGPSADHHRDELTRYILRERPAVLCLNSAASINDELITAYVACNPSRIMLETTRFSTLSKPLIGPSAIVEALVGFDTDTLDFGLQVLPDRFDVGPTGCVVPSRLAIAYALAVAVAAGARRVLLAGIDGYPAGDPRQEEMLAVLAAYEHLDQRVPLMAITPSTYPVPQGSVYAPEI